MRVFTAVIYGIDVVLPVLFWVLVVKSARLAGMPLRHIAPVQIRLWLDLATIFAAFLLLIPTFYPFYMSAAMCIIWAIIYRRSPTDQETS